MTSSQVLKDKAEERLGISIAALKAKYRDPMKRRGRAYGLGERNPDTLPDVYPGPVNRSEHSWENDEGTAKWARLGKLSRGLSFVGAKYV